MSIQRYSQFIEESKKIDNHSDALLVLENEYLRMRSEGLSESHINENIFGSLFGSLGGGFSDTIKDYVIDWAADKLGIEYLDETGQPTFFYQVVRNVIEDVNFTELGGYFGKGSCKNWSKAIVKGLAETIEERGIQYLLPKLGLKMDMNTGLGGTIAASLREATTNAINNTKFISDIEKTISDKICGFNLGDILSGKITQGDQQKIASQIAQAETKDPEIYTKAMKSGLSNILSF